MDTKSLYLLRTEIFDVQNPDMSVEVVSEDVKIIASNDGKCHIEIFAKSESAKHMADQIDINANGEKILVHLRRKGGGLRQLVHGHLSHLSVLIQIPSTSTVKVRNISGDVEVEQTVKRLEVTSISGDISVLQNPSEICTLNSISGDITARTFSGCHYSLRSISGDITVHVAPNLEIDMDGKSISGDMKSEISLNTFGNSISEDSELVVITANTISGDFALARN